MVATQPLRRSKSSVEAWERMVETAGVMPCQFGPSSSPIASTPSGHLMLAVVEEALANIEAGKRHRTHEWAVRRWWTVVDWLRDPDDTYTFSFLSICQHLGWDAERMRGRLLMELPPPQKLRLVRIPRRDYARQQVAT